ncbi:hypothetical protein P3T39_002839 [Kitasatospora sp. GP82]|nr:hypothetical protein [Kitasatospora sp. GP82]
MITDSDPRSDQISDGRLTVHFISGGIDSRQHCEGDILTKDQRYGSQRLLAIAEAGERYDRALWTATAAATGGAGDSNALVGTPETVARALLDYYDLGVDTFCAHGYAPVDDAIDFGRYVIPIVRQEVAKRDAEKAAKAAQAEHGRRRLIAAQV